jgi:hypothetical protein
MTDSQMADELRALYDWSTDDIREFKSRQWQVTHYCLLLYAALALMARDARGSSAADIWLLIMALIAGVIVAGFAWNMLGNLQGAIELRRARMEHIREKHFSPEFRAARLPEDKRGKEPTVGVFRFVAVAGFVLLGLYLMTMHPCK